MENVELRCRLEEAESKLDCCRSEVSDAQKQISQFESVIEGSSQHSTEEVKLLRYMKIIKEN